MSDFDAAGLRELLDAVAGGALDPAAALARLRALPFAEVADARVDHHRALRTGIPETVFAGSKTETQVETIVRELYQRQGFALVTRLEAPAGERLQTVLPEARYDRRARSLACGRLAASGRRVGVVCAGTSDLPVADEAAFALAAWGHEVIRQTDVGVAGLHRLLVGIDDLEQCAVLVVVAGMEGALPGVIAGLVSVPIVAVPTSVGYGTAFGGVAALLSMLNACASGLGVVNIDNGYGAAALAHKIALSGSRQLRGGEPNTPSR